MMLLWSPPSIDYLKTPSYVDMDRLGMMGWSHGGFITSLTLTREGQPVRAGAAMVPFTNLIFRLSDHGPGYQRDYAAEEGIKGLPFGYVPEYIRCARSSPTWPKPRST